MRRQFLWGSILLSLCLFLLCGVDSTFGRSGMKSADVVGTGGTEYCLLRSFMSPFSLEAECHGLYLVARASLQGR